MEKISTEKAPKAIGPYSQAIKSGNYVFLSGQIPINPETGKIVNGGIKEQTEIVIRNIIEILKAAGSNIEDVVKVNVYLASMEDFEEMNSVYAKYFLNRPARSTIEVGKLPKGVKIEIDVIAEVKKDG